MDGLDLTGEQIRAARALLRIEQRQLAVEAALSLETIKRLEGIHGPVGANVRTLRSLRSAFFRLGAVFHDHDDISTIVATLHDGERRSANPLRSRPDRKPGQVAQPVHRLIYYSTAATAVCGEAESLRTVRDISAQSAPNNRRDDISGALLFCGRHFLQVLEGERPAVERCFERIREDARHSDVHLLQSRSTTRRAFHGWRMLSGRMSEIDEVITEDLKMRDGFHPERLNPAEALGLLVLVTLTEEHGRAAPAV